MEIPFIVAQSKEHPCFEGGDSACPPGPPLCPMMVLVLPSPGFYLFGGAGGGGENPMSMRFFRTFLQDCCHGIKP
jgi:hypothetical protein